MIEVRWILSQSASCFHTADVLRRGLPVADSKLTSAIAETVEGLLREVDKFGLDQERLWEQLVPLSAGIEDNHQLAEVLLRKLVGGGDLGDLFAPPLAGWFTEIEGAVRRRMPDLLDGLVSGAKAVRGAWETWGPNLLGRVAELTDARLIVSRVEVAVVYPTLGGGGAAHLPYNSARIEAVETDPWPDLPEAVRLAWMASQLNVDLPMFSETIRRDRLPALAAAAMLPPTLAAAEGMELARCDEATVRRALAAWHVPTLPSEDDPAAVLWTWWETLSASQPPWQVALSALDRMFQPLAA